MVSVPATIPFEVHLDVFEGPFDLLLSLIAKHQLDVTEVALSQVTDEFLSFTRSKGPDWDLDQASEFLVVAATLLDLKTARLLPRPEIADEEDLALLEARDLLFARLLQYRAYKQAAAWLGEQIAAEGQRHPRRVPLEPEFAALLPEVVLGLGPAGFAGLAAKAMTPRPVPVVATSHLHQPRVSVAEQAAVLRDRLAESGGSTFWRLCSDAPDVAHVIARFLAVLDLYRDGLIAFEQVEPLGDLHIRWSPSAPPAAAVAPGPSAEER